MVYLQPPLGWLYKVGMLIVFVVLAQFFPIDISVIFSMIFSVLLTGAFHEDGLADVCDGFGGAFSKERKLEIMKDSRLGTYGAVEFGSYLRPFFFSVSFNQT